MINTNSANRPNSPSWTIVIGSDCNGRPLFPADAFCYKVTADIGRAWCKTWDGWGDRRTRYLDYSGNDYPTDRVYTGSIPYNQTHRRSLVQYG